MSHLDEFNKSNIDCEELKRRCELDHIKKQAELKNKRDGRIIKVLVALFVFCGMSLALNSCQESAKKAADCFDKYPTHSGMTFTERQDSWTLQEACEKGIIE